MFVHRGQHALPGRLLGLLLLLGLVLGLEWYHLHAHHVALVLRFTRD